MQGRTNRWPHRRIVGSTGRGAYAELMGMPASSLVAMPKDLSSHAAALTEPAATAWHAVNLTLRTLVRPLHECRVLVIGGGAIGMLMALLLRHLGVDRLTLAELNPLRRQAVATHAGSLTVDPRRDPLSDPTFTLFFAPVGAKAYGTQPLRATNPGGPVPLTTSTPPAEQSGGNHVG